MESESRFNSGISLNIFLIITSEIISNSFATDVVKDLGK